MRKYILNTWSFFKVFTLVFVFGYLTGYLFPLSVDLSRVESVKDHFKAAYPTQEYEPVSDELLAKLVDESLF